MAHRSSVWDTRVVRAPPRRRDPLAPHQRAWWDLRARFIFGAGGPGHRSVPGGDSTPFTGERSSFGDGGGGLSWRQSFTGNVPPGRSTSAGRGRRLVLRTIPLPGGRSPRRGCCHPRSSTPIPPPAIEEAGEAFGIHRTGLEQVPAHRLFPWIRRWRSLHPSGALLPLRSVRENEGGGGARAPLPGPCAGHAVSCFCQDRR